LPLFYVVTTRHAGPAAEAAWNTRDPDRVAAADEAGIPLP
jgi:nuclear transport factor 2 (NTF2) superfamily protein